MLWSEIVPAEQQAVDSHYVNAVVENMIENIEEILKVPESLSKLTKDKLMTARMNGWLHFRDKVYTLIGLQYHFFLKKNLPFRKDDGKKGGL